MLFRSRCSRTGCVISFRTTCWRRTEPGHPTRAATWTAKKTNAGLTLARWMRCVRVDGPCCGFTVWSWPYSTRVASCSPWRTAAHTQGLPCVVVASRTGMCVAPRMGCASICAAGRCGAPDWRYVSSRCANTRVGFNWYCRPPTRWPPVLPLRGLDRGCVIRAALAPAML